MRIGMQAEPPSSQPSSQQVLTQGAKPYCVVYNAEQQYSVWPLGMVLPLGWMEVQPPMHGGQEACLKYIDTVWQDIRPASMRQI